MDKWSKTFGFESDKALFVDWANGKVTDEIAKQVLTLYYKALVSGNNRRGTIIKKLQKCGNGKVEGYEDCDGGKGCSFECICSPGFVAFNPPRTDCRSLMQPTFNSSYYILAGIVVLAIITAVIGFNAACPGRDQHTRGDSGTGNRAPLGLTANQISALPPDDMTSKSNETPKGEEETKSNENTQPDTASKSTLTSMLKTKEKAQPDPAVLTETPKPDIEPITTQTPKPETPSDANEAQKQETVSVTNKTSVPIETPTSHTVSATNETQKQDAASVTIETSKPETSSVTNEKPMLDSPPDSNQAPVPSTVSALPKSDKTSSQNETPKLESPSETPDTDDTEFYKMPS